MTTTNLRQDPRQRRSQTTIDSILDAAERLVVEDGQVTFSAQRLATEVGCSIGRVYYWFADLDEVMLAVRQRIAEDLTRFDANFALYITERPAAAILALVGTKAERDVVLGEIRPWQRHFLVDAIVEREHQ